MKKKVPAKKQPSSIPQSQSKGSAGTLLGGALLSVVVIAAVIGGTPVKLKKKEINELLLRATKASNDGNFEEADRITTMVYPSMERESMGQWDGTNGIASNVTAKLHPYRVPVSDPSVEIYKIPNMLTESDAADLKKLYKITYDNYFLEGPICLDHQWNIEPDFLRPTWYYKDKIVDSGVLKESDFMKTDTSVMQSWCLKPKAATKENIIKLKDFLNVSRSVIAHRGVSKVIDRVEKKISDATGLPLSRAYYAQLLQYEPGEEYNVHTDCTINRQGTMFDDRVFTTLLYLSEPEGGETGFPLLGLDIKPNFGDLIVWKNTDDLGHCNTKTAHIARAVKSGVKYAYQKWFRIKMQDHTSPVFSGATNGFSCDRNNACREYLHIHRLPKKVKSAAP
eukprot:TRINITY_DN24190_c0_g1_i1.p1 TRINITY_DN24190_c0_g1~~TRINITY_DN24190_c0_g1_i1.p1  ORF type:complete len:394 (+),score=48.28 TRINITY_DN24190_c0_g1_i1:55-1236(+)